MIVFRLAQSRYADDLSGRGAELGGGRWNSKGTAIVYTCESRALCTTEIAVHTPLGNIPVDYKLITIEIPGKIKVYELKNTELPVDWKSIPPAVSTQLIGNKFVKEGKYLVMRVPSVVVPGDYNYLINPRHPEIKKIKIIKTEDFSFDERLFR